MVNRCWWSSTIALLNVSLIPVFSHHNNNFVTVSSGGSCKTVGILGRPFTIPKYHISDTRVYRQNDLITVYRKVKNPLPFNFGYGSLLGKNRSNLLFAEKKEKK